MVDLKDFCGTRVPDRMLACIRSDRGSKSAKTFNHRAMLPESLSEPRPCTILQDCLNTSRPQRILVPKSHPDFVLGEYVRLSSNLT